MSLRLEIQKKMMERSPRVKALDFHSEHPWIVFGLYSGTLGLYDYSNNTCIRTIQASAFPVRAVRFIVGCQWIACGSDDFHIRVFNYNTMEKVKEFQGHGDFIRGILVHPSEPFMMSCSDEAKIKIWNYQKDFSLVATLDEHKHFVMAMAFNPRDLTKFASGSMDKTIKLWNITSEGKANMTLSGHKAGVNCLDFYRGDRPHIVSGSDDRTIKIWDYQTKQCLNTLTTHTLAVSAVTFHPDLPILISTGQEGITLVHHTNSYNILNSLEYNLGMGWAVDCSRENSNIIGLGFDEGSIVLRIGSDEPVVSLSNGKLLWTKSMEVFSANLKAVDLEENPSGEKVSIASKELGHTDIYPSYLRHSPNSHYFALCNQTEFAVIKTASFKSVVLGSGTSLVWHSDNDFAVLDNDVINIYSNQEYSSSIKLPFPPKKITEGYLLGAIGPESVLLYDWDRIEAPIHDLHLAAQKIWWNQHGNMMAIATNDKLVIFSLNKKTWALTEMLNTPAKVTSGVFTNRTFIYMTANAKIYFTIHNKSFFLQNYEKKKFILGLIEQQNRLYLFDKNNSLYSLYIPFKLFAQMTEFLEKVEKDVPEIPVELRDTMARVLHEFNFVRQAYKIVQNQDHKFELALQLGRTRQAHKIASQTNSTHKIRLIGDICLKKGEIQMAIQCFKQVDDLNSLLLVYSSLSLPDQLLELGQRAEYLTKMNVAYTCYFLTNKPNKCVDVLLKGKKYSEAALFSRTYCPERVEECVRLWKESIPDKMIANKISDLQEEEEEDDQNDEEQADGEGENDEEEIEA